MGPSSRLSRLRHAISGGSTRPVTTGLLSRRRDVAPPVPGERGTRRQQIGRSLALSGAGGALLAGSWFGLRLPAVQRADVRTGDAIRFAGTPVLDRIVIGTTDLGSVYAVLGTALALTATGRYRAAADVLAVGAAAWQIAQHSKTRVKRARPYEAHGVRRLIRPPTGSSFPSGHAAVGAALCAVLAHHAGSARARRTFGALAAYVPVTRVYVGVHYPTDVIGGAGMGLILGGFWRGPVAATARRPVSLAADVLRWAF